MSEETKLKFKQLCHAGYYEDDKTYTMEILKEELLNFLKHEFDVDNIKII